MRNLNNNDEMMGDLLSGQVNTTEGVIIKRGGISCYASFLGDYQMIFDLLSRIEEIDFEVIKIQHGTRV
jgi:hypothetical protein